MWSMTNTGTLVLSGSRTETGTGDAAPMMEAIGYVLAPAAHGPL